VNRLLIIALLLSSVVGVVRADVDKGVEAYQAGDFDTPYREFKPLADANIVIVQTSLGYMYALGEGVELDLEQSFSWFRRAAENKSSAAQMTVASMLYRGEGVAADPAQAYAWLSVAAWGADYRR
jgi:TPR repeat protein